MKPAAFDYAVARSVEEAVDTLARYAGEAKLIAGGQSLVPMLNFRLVRPAMLVDINHIPELAGIQERNGHIRVGALTRHFVLETSQTIARATPVITAAMQHVAHLAIRNRGTIGGSLSHADPAAELPMLATLFDAKIDIRGKTGSRTLLPAEFFVGALATALAEDEMLVGVDFPVPAPGTGWAFEEIARRKGDFALAAAGVMMRAEQGRMKQVRIAMMGVGDTPLRIEAAEEMLEGEAPTDATLGAAIEAAQASLTPNTDLHASSEYRRFLAGGLLRRGIRDAWDRSMGVRQ